MDLISKKELLSMTGISYGQLYRWKRERLIPEEWFIKQSSYTGQETFFPKDLVLQRIKSILELKDSYSLEELAQMLSPEATGAFLSAKALAGMEEIDASLPPLLASIYPKEQYTFPEVVLFAIFSGAIRELRLSAADTEALLRRCIPLAEALKSMDMTCVVFTVGGSHHLALVKSSAALHFDGDVQVLGSYPVSELAGQIKLKYNMKLAIKG
nr:DUF4004 family protein [Clostridium sp. D33t1_170424_F3]